jgi:uncharacterized repeat protein (TIGR02543 family)
VLVPGSGRTVSFVLNGGIGVSSSLSVAAGDAVNLGGYVPTREGYVFDGWHLDEGLTQKAGDSIIVAADMSLYAKWTPVKEPGGCGNAWWIILLVLIVLLGAAAAYYFLIFRQKRAVTYMGGDGTVLKKQAVKRGAEFKPGEFVPEKAGGVFNGWYLDQGLTQKAGDKIIVTDNLTLYAKWA